MHTSKKWERLDMGNWHMLGKLAAMQIIRSQHLTFRPTVHFAEATSTRPTYTSFCPVASAS